jgi:hypothetical protein
MNIAPDENNTTSVEAGKTPVVPDWVWHAIAIVALLALNYFLYARTLEVGFLSVDDPDYVQNNRFIEDFSRANLKTIFTKPYQANYAPANLLSYSIDVAVAHGKSAPAIHLSNVFWHGFTVLAVYLLAFVLRGEIITASAAALLFLLHPAHVEVVAWISSRKDLVATSFAILSFTCYLLWRRQRHHHPGWYGASLFCFLIAAGAKQSVILLPVVMLVWDLFVEKRIRWAVIFEKTPFVAATLFFGWMTWRAQPSTNQTWHPLMIAATELKNLRLLIGWGDYVLYRPAPDPNAMNAGEQIGLLLLAVFMWIGPVALFLRHRPIRLVLCWWILIQMIPPMTLNFVVPITDRYLFLSSVGLCILIADLLAGLATGIRYAWLPALAGLIALAGFWGKTTSAYVGEWVDPRSVWYGAHLKTSSPQVSQFLGEVYQNAGDRMNGFVKSGAAVDVPSETRLARAIEESGELERLRSEWTAGTQPRTNSIAYRDKLYGLAWDQYQEAVAHRGKLSAPNLFMNRGRLLVSEGKYEQAIPEFQTALAFAKESSFYVTRQETSTHALRAIAVAYWNMRKYREAEEWMLKAKEVQRKSGTPWVPTIDKELDQLKTLASTEGQP